MGPSGLWEVREARPEDNRALVELSVSCPMEGDIGLAVDRSPDFFVLNRLEGDSWRVGVVDGIDGHPVGCIAVAERTVHRNGEPTAALYVSDLKVHPAHRGAGVADALSQWARDACVAIGGAEALVFLTVLAGNRSMQQRMPGPRGLPHTERVATIRTHTISLLWRRRPPEAGVTVARARSGDLEEMADLWARWAPSRQFTAVPEHGSLAAWIDAAPDLDASSYRVARRPNGTLAGFMGVWNQSQFKRLRVTSYSKRLGAVRTGFNLLAPVLGAAPLPPPGGALRNLTAVNCCVFPDDPGVLRALVVDIYNASLRQGSSFLNVGLDVNDPLASGLSGLLAQPTDVWLCTASLPERPAPVFDGRPSHHEIALV